MNKIFYYLEVTCITDCHYPFVDFHKGEVLYYNPKASSNEMYLFKSDDEESYSSKTKYGKYRTIGQWSWLPFTRKKQYAKKWQIKRYPENIKRIIESYGEFTCEIKEIKVTYKEEEQ